MRFFDLNCDEKIDLNEFKENLVPIFAIIDDCHTSDKKNLLNKYNYD